jgi:hypothetical protein
MTLNTKKAYWKADKDIRDCHNGKLFPEQFSEIENEKEEKARKKDKEKAAKTVVKQAEVVTDKTHRLQDALSDLKAIHHFGSLWDFINALFSSKDRAISS